MSRELVLQLRETGGILVEDGAARLGSPDVRIPATIQDIIAARVDRLESVLKVVLQGAAVIGRRFGVSLLSQVVDTPPERHRPPTATLHGSDFVFPSADDPGMMYSFKHALTQDVIYGGLLERRRRQYHRAAALGLEQLYAGNVDEVVELLVYHFGRSGDDDKAVDYGLAAAEKAQRRWANIEALAFFEEAIKRLASMPDTPVNRLRRIDAVVKQAELMFALGRHAEHVQALSAIEEIVDATADAPRKAAWYYWTGFLHSLTGARPDVSIEYCRRAVEIAEQAGLDEIRASADSCLGQVYCLPLVACATRSTPASARSQCSRRTVTSGGHAGRCGASASPPSRWGTGRAASITAAARSPTVRRSTIGGSWWSAGGVADGHTSSAATPLPESRAVRRRSTSRPARTMRR